MFDHMLDVGRQRRACAAFVHPHLDRGETIDQVQTRIARTMAHEIGHVLNLCHEDGGGQSTIMYWDQPLPFVLADDPTFAETSVAHLVRGPDEVLRPDSAVAYGDRGGCQHEPRHLPCGNCASISSLGRSDAMDIELKLYPGLSRSSKPRAEVPHVVGEPLAVELTIRNTGKVALQGMDGASSRNGRIVFLLSDTHGRTRLLRPPLMSCDSSNGSDLAPNETLSLHEFLAFRDGGPITRRPGRFELRAQVWWGASGRRATRSS